MIGQLRGKLLEKKLPSSLLLEVQGVGYWVHTPLSTFFTLPELGQEVVLRIHMLIREDAHLLFGFSTVGECELFQELIKLNGVGPKVALAILSALSPFEFAQAMQSQDIAQLQRVPGIGAKTAQRIAVEMQHRITKLSCLQNVCSQPANALSYNCEQEAMEALVSLGYKMQEAKKAVDKVKRTALSTGSSAEWSAEALIKEALQGLARV